MLGLSSFPVLRVVMALLSSPLPEHCIIGAVAAERWWALHTSIWCAGLKGSRYSSPRSAAFTIVTPPSTAS